MIMLYYIFYDYKISYKYHVLDFTNESIIIPHYPLIIKIYADFLSYYLMPYYIRYKNIRI